jgi:hypothetical protein
LGDPTAEGDNTLLEAGPKNVDDVPRDAGVHGAAVQRQRSGTMARDKRLIDEKASALIEMTAAFSSARLDDEYGELCERLIRKMARKRSVPFLRGKPEIWAAAVVYAVGQINFLFDKSFEPHVTAGEICDHFGAKKSSVSQKAKAIRDMFKLDYWNPEFSTSRVLARSPLKDLMMVDDLIVHRGALARLFEEAAEFATVGAALPAGGDEETNLPGSARGWLDDVARAYREARRAARPAEEALGRPIAAEELFHLAPHIFFAERGRDLPVAKRNEVVKMTLRSYLSTLEHAEGGADLKRSPLLAFAFSWIVAHMMADLLEEEEASHLMDLCVEEANYLEGMAEAGVPGGTA